MFVFVCFLAVQCDATALAQGQNMDLSSIGFLFRRCCSRCASSLGEEQLQYKKTGFQLMASVSEQNRDE